MSRILAKSVLLLPGFTLGIDNIDNARCHAQHGLKPLVATHSIDNGYAKAKVVVNDRDTKEAWDLLHNITFRENETDLSKVPRGLRSDPDVVMAFVKRNGRNLKHADPMFKGYKPIVLAAVKQDWHAVWDMDHFLRADKDVMLEAVQQSGGALQFAEGGLRADYDLVLEALRQDGEALQFAEEGLRADFDVVIEAVMQNGFALRHASDFFKADKDVVREAVKQKGGALQFAEDRRGWWNELDGGLQADHELVLEAVKQDGDALRFAQGGLRANRKIVLEAVKQGGWNGNALQYAQGGLRGDRELVLEAVEQNGFALYHAADGLKADPAIVLEALAQQASAWRHADGEKRQRQTILKSVRENGYWWQGTALRHAAQDFRANAAFMLKAVRVYGLALKDAAEDIKKNPSIVSEAIRQNSAALEFQAEDSAPFAWKTDCPFLVEDFLCCAKGEARACVIKDRGIEDKPGVYKCVFFNAEGRRRGPFKRMISENWHMWTQVNTTRGCDAQTDRYVFDGKNFVKALVALGRDKAAGRPAQDPKRGHLTYAENVRFGVHHGVPMGRRYG